MMIRSLQIGTVGARLHGAREVQTAFFKQPVEGSLRLTTLGFEGDEQADHVHHGGPEKATLLYSLEHYAHWERWLGRHPGAAALGENLTTEGLTEAEACIGDTYQVGEAVVQVCQPRVPCFKVEVRHKQKGMVDEVLATGYTGFYVRVLKEGLVGPGDRLTRVGRPAGALTVARAHRILHFEPDNVEGLQHLLAAEGLAQVWQEAARKRLARHGPGG